MKSPVSATALICVTAVPALSRTLDDIQTDGNGTNAMPPRGDSPQSDDVDAPWAYVRAGEQ